MAMSVRERIAQNILDTLQANQYTKTGDLWIRKISRDPIVFEELSRESFPAVYIETTNEVREDLTMGGPDITRLATVEFILDVYVAGANRDSQLNYCLDLIETALDVDRRRSGNADDTQLREIETIEVSEAAPYMGMRMVYDVIYCYKRGVS